MFKCNFNIYVKLMKQSIYSFFEVRFFSNDKSLKVEGLIITFTCQFKIVIE